MPAPKRPNTAAATAAVRRRGDETAAERLREHGWIVIPPEVATNLSDDVRRQITEAPAGHDAAVDGIS